MGTLTGNYFWLIEATALCQPKTICQYICNKVH